MDRYGRTWTRTLAAAAIAWCFVGLAGANEYRAIEFRAIDPTSPTRVNDVAVDIGVFDAITTGAGNVTAGYGIDVTSGTRKVIGEDLGLAHADTSEQTTVTQAQGYVLAALGIDPGGHVTSATTVNRGTGTAGIMPFWTAAETLGDGPLGVSGANATYANGEGTSGSLMVQRPGSIMGWTHVTVADLLTTGFVNLADLLDVTVADRASSDVLTYSVPDGAWVSRTIAQTLGGTPYLTTDGSFDADDLSDNAIGDLSDVDDSDADTSYSLVWNGAVWVAREYFQPADADLADLADGTLSGGKIGSGIDAGNISVGTLAVARGGTGNTGLGAAFGVTYNNSTQSRLDSDSAFTYSPTLGYLIVPDLDVIGEILQDSATLIDDDGNYLGAYTGTVVGEAYGGTGLSSYTTGDLIYASGTDTLGRLGVGTAGKLLRSSGTAPAWSTATAPEIAGTLPVASTITDNRLLLFNGTGGEVEPSIISDDGAEVSVGGTVSATNLSGTNAGDVTLAGTPDYLTLAGQVLTRGLIDLATDVTGTLGTGNFSAAADLTAEGYLDNNAAGDILIRSQLDARYLQSFTETDPIYSGDPASAITSDNIDDWITAYNLRYQWNGGSTGLTASTGRTSLGLGSAATRAAEDTLTNGSALPDGAAITSYVGGQVSTHAADVDAHHAPVTLSASVDGIFALTGQALDFDTFGAGVYKVFATNGGGTEKPELLNLTNNHLPSGATLDSEWDTLAEIESATGYDFSSASNIDTGTLADARIASTIARDSELAGYETVHSTQTPTLSSSGNDISLASGNYIFASVTYGGPTAYFNFTNATQGQLVYIMNVSSSAKNLNANYYDFRHATLYGIEDCAPELSQGEWILCATNATDYCYYVLDHHSGVNMNYY